MYITDMYRKRSVEIKYVIGVLRNKNMVKRTLEKESKWQIKDNLIKNDLFVYTNLSV